jgi:hypothetical protein
MAACVVELTAVHLLPPGKLLACVAWRVVWEQNLASEVLGAKGVNSEARPARREIAKGALSHQYSRTKQDEIDAGEFSFSRRRLGAGREPIRKTRDRAFSGNVGVRAFWPETAKNFPLAVHQFRAGKCPHPAAQDPSKARQATSSWRWVRGRKSRNAPAFGAGALTLQQA